MMAIRKMPARFYENAPDIVKAGILDIVTIVPAQPLDYDIILKPEGSDDIAGVDFGRDGARGCHFFLKRHELRAYRDRNRRKRVAWAELPEATKRAIVAYLEWNPEAESE